MYLQFDFHGKSTHFCQPLYIIETHLHHEVSACFKKIQQALDEGCYAAGYVSYEAASAFTPYLKTHHKSTMPLLWFGIFKKPSQGSPPPIIPLSQIYDWAIKTSRKDYQKAIQYIHENIAQGNVYQVNYTARLTTTMHKQAAYSYYQKIRHAQQANYCAYLDTDDRQILSASPELFFHWQQGKITTKPMKGTIARGKTLAEDRVQRKILSESDKDRSENLMIVDLLRNDLSKIAHLNSIKVPELFTIEKYPTVLQMTSTITAETRPDTTLFDIFKALFPCGSITGAPKASAMQIITQLETSQRDIYCGAIGFITPDQEAIFNVPIRTLHIENQTNTATYAAGGGITWSSTVTGEYQELLAKAEILSTNTLPEHLLESLLLCDGQYFLLALHLRRLKNSAHYFNFKFFYTQTKQQLQALAQEHHSGNYKVRLLLNQQGEITLTKEPIDTTPSILQANWSALIMQSSNRLLYHKTTNRSFYPASSPNLEQLLLNEQEQVTEFTTGNIVISQQGKFLTPPQTVGLLNGTLREWLLKRNHIQEKILYKEDIEHAEHIFFINSVRGIRKVILTC